MVNIFSFFHCRDRIRSLHAISKPAKCEFKSHSRCFMLSFFFFIELTKTAPNLAAAIAAAFDWYSIFSDVLGLVFPDEDFSELLLIGCWFCCFCLLFVVNFSSAWSKLLRNFSMRNSLAALADVCSFSLRRWVSVEKTMSDLLMLKRHTWRNSLPMRIS